MDGWMENYLSVCCAPDSQEGGRAQTASSRELGGWAPRWDHLSSGAGVNARAGRHQVRATSYVHRAVTCEPQDVTWRVSWKGQEGVEYRSWQQRSMSRL